VGAVLVTYLTGQGAEIERSHAKLWIIEAIVRFPSGNNGEPTYYRHRGIDRLRQRPPGTLWVRPADQ